MDLKISNNQSSLQIDNDFDVNEKPRGFFRWLWSCLCSSPKNTPVLSAEFIQAAMNDLSSKEEGNNGEQDKDFFSYYLKLAEEGNSAAQYRVAINYHEGRNRQQNLPEARRWYKAAGEQGHQNAKDMYKIFFEKGYGVSADSKENEKIEVS